MPHTFILDEALPWIVGIAGMLTVVVCLIVLIKRTRREKDRYKGEYKQVIGRSGRSQSQKSE